MRNVSKDLRATLDQHFRDRAAGDRRGADFPASTARASGCSASPRAAPDARSRSETVYIPEEGRGTLCVSSQVGCTLTCTFCHTGTQRLVRNLEPSEIVGQVLTARERLGDFPDASTPQGAIVPSEGRLVSNVVMMGMGEPLYNYDNVKSALAVVSDGDGLALSKRRITLSTSGVVPMIEKTGEEMGVMLAISLHAVTDELRDVLVPINKKYPIKA